MAQGSRLTVREGAVLGGYRLGKALGRGGMGVVYAATDLRTGEQAAVKVLRGSMDDPQVAKAFARFELEVRAVQQIRHPGVVRFRSTGHHEGDDGAHVAYYAMERVDGVTLAEVVARTGAVPPAAAAAMVGQAARALGAAHATGVIHRDVKPENVMLARDGRVVVLDFGICKFDDVSNLTAAGQVMGTGRYLTPEHLAGITPDERSDVFALGALLFFLATGTHLRASAAVEDLIIGMQQGADLRRVQQSGLPPEVRKVLNNALARDPAHRYPAADVLAGALDDVVRRLSTLEPQGHIALLLDALSAPAATAPPVDGERTDEHAVVPAAAPSPWETVRARLRQTGSRRVALAAAAVAGVLVLALGLGLARRRPPPASRPAATAPAPSRQPADPVPTPAPAHAVEVAPAAALPSAAPAYVPPPSEWPAAPAPPAPAAPDLPPEAAVAPPAPVTRDAPVTPPEAPPLVVGGPGGAAPAGTGLRVGDRAPMTAEQQRALACAEWAAAVGAPPGSCPPQ